MRRWGEIHLTRVTTRSTTDLTRYFDGPDKNIYINNHHNNLPEDLTIVSHSSRIEIISKWLKGEQRDRIAGDLGLGAGTVSAIISEWKSQIGIPEGEALRQFSTELRRADITASHCVLGFRILRVLRKVGVDEETLESFVSEVYQGCQSKGITPLMIVKCSQEILSLVEKIPISQIPQYNQKLIVEKQALEQEIRILRRDQARAKEEREEALKNSQTTIHNIDEVIGLKSKLSKFGLSFDSLAEISKLTMILENVKEYSFDSRTIANKLSTIDNLERRQLKLQEGLAIEEKRLQKITSERLDREKKLSLCHMRLGLYDHLERMECGLKELTILRNTILEIAKSNNINPHFAVKKFYSDIKDQYDAKLGLEKRIEEMNKSLMYAQQEFRKISLKCSKLKDLYDKLEELFEYGVSQNDLVHWNSIVKGYTKDLTGMNQDLSR